MAPLRVAALMLCMAVPALAQRGGYGSSIRPDNDLTQATGRPERSGGRGSRGPQAPAAATPLTSAPAPWPRLEAGAKLCRTLGDLQRLSAVEAGAEAGAAARCHLMPRMVGVTIVSRSGPGATQVQLLSADAEIGWTDVYLPDRAAPGATARRP